MPPTDQLTTASSAKAAAAVGKGGLAGLPGGWRCCRWAEQHRCRSRRKSDSWQACGKRRGGHLRTPAAVSAITAVEALVIAAAAQAYRGSGGAAAEEAPRACSFPPCRC